MKIILLIAGITTIIFPSAAALTLAALGESIRCTE